MGLFKIKPAMVVLFKMFSYIIFVFIFSPITISSVVAEDDNCFLPPYPKNGMYTVKNYPTAKPGESYPSVKLDVSCDTGYQTDNTSIFCINGEWSSPIPECVRFCRLPDNLSVEYRCEQSGKSRKCESTVLEGTVVTPVCRAPGYFSNNALAKMHCIEGIWDYEAFCIQACGTIPSNDQLVLDGRIKLPPWHASVYKKSVNHYQQICGGSLISSTVVITAAHCFWNDVKKLLPASDYVVAVGKVYRPFYESRDRNSQQSNVADIKIPERFQGAATNYQDDIAMLFVETPFIYHRSVRPVCLDFDYNFDKNQLTAGNLGKAVSFSRKSPILWTVDLPYIETEDCFANSPPAFRQFISSDKFCAGLNNDTSLCIGDSGVGLAFPVINLGITRYYLRGVCSVSPANGDSCDSFNTFTSILKHENFIKQYLK